MDSSLLISLGTSIVASIAAAILIGVFRTKIKEVLDSLDMSVGAALGWLYVFWSFTTIVILVALDKWGDNYLLFGPTILAVGVLLGRTVWRK